MTVNETIAILTALADKGHGDKEIVFRDFGDGWSVPLNKIELDNVTFSDYEEDGIDSVVFEN